MDSLERVLAAFAQGQGSNILTITCANPETFERATQDPEKYDVLRVRMGGWSEFFVAMFPGHQAQHQRRPLSTPDAEGWRSRSPDASPRRGGPPGTRPG
ncbi:hypothetical protein P2318_13520 [Myxococcaceae bacterium GXIMD 01537]